MSELVASKKRCLITEVEDDELTLSEIKAQRFPSFWGSKSCLKEAKKDENGRVV
jgi:hypothetical protein